MKNKKINHETHEMDADRMLFVIARKQNMLDLFVNFRVFRG